MIRVDRLPGYYVVGMGSAMAYYLELVDMMFENLFRLANFVFIRVR
jgi:hypothetical protein